MKLCFQCFECATETPKPSLNFAFLDILNDGLYKFTCTKGHKTVTALQEQKFEILYEIGANAILDGYYREAISSFSASLERFYEFYVKIIWLSRNIAEETIEENWNKITQQSERQLGAFICLYLIETGRPPITLSNKWRKFRNDVIHKGLIPKKEEAIEYGQEVLDLILPVLNDLKNNNEEEVQKIVFQHLRRIHSKGPVGTKKSTLSYTTIVSISAGKSGAKKLEDELRRLAFERELFGGIEKKATGRTSDKTKKHETQ